MEKLPNFTVVGRVGEEEKQKAEQDFTRRITSDVRLTATKEEEKEIEENEIPKTSQQEKLFQFVNDELKEMQKASGVTPYEFPLRNVFIFSPEFFKEKISDLLGLAKIEKQVVLLKQVSEDFSLILTAFHEIFHCQGKIVSQLFSVEKNPEEIDKNTLRGGFGVYSAHKKDLEGLPHSHFRGVEEALAAKAEQEFRNKLIALPEFSDIFERFYSPEGRQEIKKIMEQANVDFDEIEWFDIEKNEKKVFSYHYQRKVLNYVIQEAASDSQLSEEAVYQMFLKSHFTGIFGDLGKLVEKTFGLGSFRRLGDMKEDSNNSAIQTLEALQKMRLGHKREGVKKTKMLEEIAQLKKDKEQLEEVLRKIQADKTKGRDIL